MIVPLIPTNTDMEEEKKPEKKPSTTTVSSSLLTDMTTTVFSQITNPTNNPDMPQEQPLSPLQKQLETRQFIQTYSTENQEVYAAMPLKRCIDTAPSIQEVGRQYGTQHRRHTSHLSYQEPGRRQIRTTTTGKAESSSEVHGRADSARTHVAEGCRLCTPHSSRPPESQPRKKAPS